MDPILVEVLSNRLISIVNEQQAALIRTAFSTVVRESEDLACGVFDSRGQMVAQSLTGTPGHINAMATGVRHFLTTFPPATLRPGDVLLTNDPWQTSGQINDITVVTPVFAGGRPIAFFANTCHAADIGGNASWSTLGSMPAGGPPTNCSSLRSLESNSSYAATGCSRDTTTTASSS